MARALALAITLAAAVAAAQVHDPDTEAARTHYQRGSEHYAAGRYRAALDEFTRARNLAAIPALDYDIARCLDRLEEWGDAARAYERYLSEVPDAPDAAELRERVERLHARAPKIAQLIAPLAVPGPLLALTAPAPPKRPRLRVAAAATGAIALATLGSGAGLLGSVAADWPSLEADCRVRPCAPSDWADAQRRAQAGWALIAIGAVAAIADVALLALAFRRR
jgi:tetratricopeptide (TPR) repeat protein